MKKWDPPVMYHDGGELRNTSVIHHEKSRHVLKQDIVPPSVIKLW